MSNKPDLSIIILNWNTKELLGKCLESIPKNKDYEVIVIDNASCDNSKEFLKKLLNAKSLNLKVIFNKKNLGFSKANNQGIKTASGKYILLLNSDTEICDSALEKLLKYFKSNSRVLAVSPLLLNPDKTYQQKYYLKLPSPFRIGLYHNLILRPLIVKTFLRGLLINSLEKKQPFLVDQLSATALMVRSEVLKKYFLDEDYPFLFEDVDWCYRIQKDFPNSLLVVPDSKVIHLGGGSWKQWLDKDPYHFYQHHFRSLLIFAKKHQVSLIFIYKIVLAFCFLTNFLVNLIFLRLKNAEVQRKLFFWVLFNKNI
ncbi:MAG: glycosyltransferase family 2 protein [Candidatus Shapirobacteria bacterium]